MLYGSITGTVSSLLPVTGSRREDASSSTVPARVIAGDGTAAGTTVDGGPAAALPWWQLPALHYSVDQNEENTHIRRVIAQLRSHGVTSAPPSP